MIDTIFSKRSAWSEYEFNKIVAKGLRTSCYELESTVMIMNYIGGSGFFAYQLSNKPLAIAHIYTRY